MFYQFNLPGDVYHRASEQLQSVHAVPWACWMDTILTGFYFTSLMCLNPGFSEFCALSFLCLIPCFDGKGP